MNISNAIIGNRIENPQAQGFQSIKSNDFMKSLANIMPHDVMRYSIPDQYCSDLYMEMQKSSTSPLVCCRFKL